MSKQSKLRRYFNKRQIYKHIYFEANHDINKTILIDGVGRSGTTWLAEILADLLSYRQIFEPFKPENVQIFKDFPYKGYIPPNYKNDEYFKIFKKILSGEVKNKWVDQDNRVFRPKGRIVKSIRSSFYLKWIKNNFPEIPIVFMIRHPCAVVLSRAKMGWSENELDLFLKQELLVRDHLESYIPIIERAETLIQKNACIWCIQNLIAFSTMEQKDWIVIAYEDLFKNPQEQINRILSYIGIDKKFKVDKLGKKYSLQTFKDSAVVVESNPLEAWRKRLPQEDLNDILSIVKSFSLDNIYGIDTMPKKKFN
jgi:hypothetical protein